MQRRYRLQLLFRHFASQ